MTARKVAKRATGVVNVNTAKFCVCDPTNPKKSGAVAVPIVLCGTPRLRSELVPLYNHTFKKSTVL